MEELGRILLVDDDSVDRLTVQRLLREAAPHELTEATDLASAQSALDEQRFDCVLLDFRLPDGTAIDLLQRLSAEGRHKVPILVLTGLDDQATATTALHHGAQDYLVKGQIDSGLLVRAIHYAIERFRVGQALAHANEQLERLALFDPLTETLNRRGLEQLLPDALAEAAHNGAPVFAALVDCDDFKRINDQFGHAAGDRVLQEVSARIRTTARTKDHVARVGGDEFLILLRGARSREAFTIAERVRQTVASQPIRVSTESVSMTVSLGVFAIPDGVRSVTELLESASGALRSSKQGGKDRVSLATSCSDGFLTIADDLVALLSNSELLSTSTQAIVRLSDDVVVGREVLVHGPAAPLESPDTLFRYCVEKRIAPAVDVHYCLKACLKACLLVARTLKEPQVHVRLSWSTLAATPIDELLAELPSGTARARFCFELSIEELVGNPARWLPMITEIRRGGVRFALGHVDFGRGSLEALVLLRPDLIKIDRKLVAAAARDSHEADLIRRLAQIADSLGVEVAGVGVESQAHRAVLREAGVTYGQGFLWDQSLRVPGLDSPTSGAIHST